MTCFYPGATIGILGGGQLGRMLAQAAARLGLRTHIFAPEAEAPAFEVSMAHTRAAYEDRAALTKFADAVDVVTFEFENVPIATGEYLTGSVSVRPSAAALAVSQDRLREKTFLRALGLEVAPFWAIDTLQDLTCALERVPKGGILKTRRFGYDGKGQVRLTPAEDPRASLATLEDQPAILEASIDFSRELSIVAARGIDGAIAAFDLVENVHRDGILRQSCVPAAGLERLSEDARRIAVTVLTKLDYVGVMGIELFVVGDERLIVNEIAPRVHNSGHWTEAACTVSQFEQHIRAICGWPLGDPTRHSDARMVNLIGDEIEDWQQFLAAPAAMLTVYGKRTSRPGRKMGHVTYVTPPMAPRQSPPSDLV